MMLAESEYADLKWHQDGLRYGNVEVEDVSLEPGHEKHVLIFIPIKDGSAIGKGVWGRLGVPCPCRKMRHNG